MLARWWAFELVPQMTHSLWGPYFLAPLGWSLAAAVGIYCYRRIDWQPLTEISVEQSTILTFAALVGLFILSTQLILGMFANFGHSPLAHSPKWLLINFFFAGSILFAVEAARAVLLRVFAPKSLMLSLLLVSLALVAVQIPFAQFVQSGFADQARFWGALFIPMAATGLVAGFFVMYGGLRAGLLVSAPLVAFQYFSPILPVADWPMLALAGVGGPAIGLWVAEGLFSDEEENEERGFQLPSVSWVATMVVAAAIFWFGFGFFGYKPMFVPTISMEPNIEQGDVVLLGPVDPDKVKVGDIILYGQDKRTRVLHRVTDIRLGEDGGRVFILKGDNNNGDDLLPVPGANLMGKFVVRVPKLGWLPIKFQQELAKLR